MEKKMTLYELGERERQLEELLYESGGELTPEIEALMSDNADNMAAKVEGYNRIIREYDAFVNGCDEEIKRLGVKKRQAQNAKDRLKSHILDIMRLFEWSKLNGTDGSRISRSAKKSIEIDEEVFLSRYDIEGAVKRLNLPDYIKLVPKIDKTALNAALKGGAEMPEGAEYVENEFITIR